MNFQLVGANFYYSGTNVACAIYFGGADIDIQASAIAIFRAAQEYHITDSLIIILFTGPTLKVGISNPAAGTT